MIISAPRPSFDRPKMLKYTFGTMRKARIEASLRKTRPERRNTVDSGSDTTNIRGIDKRNSCVAPKTLKRMYFASENAPLIFFSVQT
mmetsp:Transcript_1553/g.2347  ORF Transcript_1553/g.2347 Transcript_1553/m.2347 type:complete len:87 (-) Transcript_1553:2091-2351(-)